MTSHAIPAGHVRLLCDDPALNLVVLMGEDSPRVSSGVGGWEVTQRPRQVGMTTWDGVEPYQLTLPLMFNGLGQNRTRTHVGHYSQEKAIRQLMRVARGDDESRPGVLVVEGLPLPADEWVIEGIDFGDAVRHVTHRIRQACTLTLREYVPPKYKQLRKRALQGAKGKTRVIVVKHGDTPARIARREHCKWGEIRDLNAGTVRKANQALKQGSKLRVPVAAARRKHRSSSGGGSRK
jgi:hypothetical protein